jgi:hypothetical protein
MISRTALRLAAMPLVACLPLAASLAQGKAPTTVENQERATEGKENLPGPATGAALTNEWRASRLIGTTMTNMFDESVGKVEDVVIDGDGKVVAVLVRVGGFLGLGETSVAIGLDHLVISQLEADQLEVRTSLSRKAIEQAASLDPDYDRPVAP